MEDCHTAHIHAPWDPMWPLCSQPIEAASGTADFFDQHDLLIFHLTVDAYTYNM